jgi:hypothetical protein
LELFVIGTAVVPTEQAGDVSDPGLVFSAADVVKVASGGHE